MNTQRSAVVWAAITDHARASGGQITLETVCHSCACHLRAQAAVALTSPGAVYEPLCASDTGALRLLDAQVTLGEGPGPTALADQRPILVPDLTDPDVMRRWPMLAPAAVRTGVCSIFVFPLILGAIAVGVLEISRTSRGWMDSDQLADALIYADTALMVHLQGDAGQGLVTDGHGPKRAGVERWAQVHHATGMIAVQAGVNLRTAFVRLRAHAFATERDLIEVADDVVARRLRFPPDLPP